MIKFKNKQIKQSKHSTKIKSMLEMRGTFSIAHQQTCPAKTSSCKICKKVSNYTSLYTAKMPERRPPRTSQNSPPQYYKPQQTKRVRNVNQEKTDK